MGDRSHMKVATFAENYSYHMKPTQCANRSCSNVIYVEDFLLHLPLQCKKCTERSKKRNNE